MRSRFTLGLLAVAAALSSAAYSHVHSDAPQPETTVTVTASADAPMYVTAPHHALPDIPHAPQHTLPIESIAIGSAIGAVSKRATRRKSGNNTDVPMFLDSDAHVMRDDPDNAGKRITTVIKGGVLIDDTDLTDDEIDELTARRVIRHATPDEIERLGRRGADAERNELVASQTAEVDAMKASQASERAALEADTSSSPDALVKLDKKHADAMAKLQDKHAKATAKLDA